MIKSLAIKNLLHFEKLFLHFDRGLHILTGESGSGKTVILNALALSEK